VGAAGGRAQRARGNTAAWGLTDQRRPSIDGARSVPVDPGHPSWKLRNYWSHQPFVGEREAALFVAGETPALQIRAGCTRLRIVAE